MIFALVYVALAASIWETRVLQGPEGTVVQNIYTLTRMIMTMVQIDASLHVPAQVGLSVVEVGVRNLTPGPRSIPNPIQAPPPGAWGVAAQWPVISCASAGLQPDLSRSVLHGRGLPAGHV